MLEFGQHVTQSDLMSTFFQQRLFFCNLSSRLCVNEKCVPLTMLAQRWQRLLVLLVVLRTRLNMQHCDYSA